MKEMRSEKYLGSIMRVRVSVCVRVYGSVTNKGWQDEQFRNFFKNLS